jgi:hypothetical protein
MHSWVPKATEFCFSLISVLLTQRTHFSEILKYYFFPAAAVFAFGYHLHIYVLLQKAVDFDGCRHDRWGCYESEAECVACSELNSRSLSDDNTHYNQELLFGVWF